MLRVDPVSLKDPRPVSPVLALLRDASELAALRLVQDDPYFADARLDAMTAVGLVFDGITPPRLPELLSYEEASAIMVRELDRFAANVLSFDAAVSRGETGKPMVMAVRGTVGLGKTKCTTDMVARVLREISPEKRIVLAVPTTKKGDELKAVFTGMGVHSVVLRGRDQLVPVVVGKAAPSEKDPEFATWPRMCGRADEVRAVSALGLSLCHKKIDGETVLCPLAAACRYRMDREEAKHARVLIVPHAALQVTMSELKSEEIAALVIDENITAQMLRDSAVEIAALVTLPSNDPTVSWGSRDPGDKAIGRVERTGDKLERARRRYARVIRVLGDLVTAAERGEAEFTIPELLGRMAPVVSDKVRDGRIMEKIDAVRDEFSWLADYERDHTRADQIRPDWTGEMITQFLGLHGLRDRWKRARLWTLITTELGAWDAAGRPAHRDTFRSLKLDFQAVTRTKDGALIQTPKLQMGWSVEPRVSGMPTLLLDADADKTLIRRWWPSLQDGDFVVLSAKFDPRIRVYQVADRTGSMKSLEREETQAEVARTAMFLARKHEGHIRSMAAQGIDARVGLFTTKKARDGIESRLVGRNGEGCAIQGKIDPTLVSMGHHGAVLGLNSWQRSSAIVVAGRLELSVEAAEWMARQIWFADAAPFAWIEADADGNRKLPEVLGFMRVDGKCVPCRTTEHPDRRVQSLIDLTRAGNLRQTLGRVRPVKRFGETEAELTREIDVYVLSSVPLGLDIPVTATLSWSDVVASKTDGVVAEGVIPDHAADLAKLAGVTYDGLRRDMSRRREKNALTPRKGRPPVTAAAAVRSVYEDVLFRPSELGLGQRGILRFHFTTAGEDGREVRRGGSVLVSPDAVDHTLVLAQVSKAVQAIAPGASFGLDDSRISVSSDDQGCVFVMDVETIVLHSVSRVWWADWLSVPLMRLSDWTRAPRLPATAPPLD